VFIERLGQGAFDRDKPFEKQGLSGDLPLLSLKKHHNLVEYPIYFAPE
jgi:hypothetical protein